MKHRTTIDDVAMAAGVSRQTVSRAINNKGEISPSTRDKVMVAVRKLGYRPSRVAQSLATQQSRIIGFVLGDISNPFFPEIARGISDVARKKGYNVFLCNTDGDSEQELDTLQALADHAVDGIIFYPSYNSTENLHIFADYFRPLVVINHLFQHPNISQIILDMPFGTELAVDYLVSKGHAAIGMLTGVQNPSPDDVRRIKGFHKALSAHGLNIVNNWIMPGECPDFETGYTSARKLLSQNSQITAIIAYNDLLALGALQACKELGKNVPADCAIVGFDDITWASRSTPALTTVGIDKYQVGQKSAERLFDMLDNPQANFPPINIDVELVIRESA